MVKCFRVSQTMWTHSDRDLNQSITQIITSVATLVGTLVMMLSISPLMTLISLVILPVSMGLIVCHKAFTEILPCQQQEYLGHINGQVEEVYGGHLVIKAFNREKDTIKEFEETNNILYDSAWKSQFLSGMMQPIMHVCRKFRLCLSGIVRWTVWQSKT